MNQLSEKSAEQYYSILLDIHQWDIDFAIKVPIFKNLLEKGILNEVTGKNHFEDKYENNKVAEAGQKKYLNDNKEILNRFGDRIKGEVRKDLFTGINDLFAKRNPAEHGKKMNFAAYMGTLNTITESIRDFSKIPIPDELISILDGKSEPPGPNPIGESKGSKKDYAKYLLNGHPVSSTGGKGPLVRDVIRLYVKQNPSVTFKKLKDIFPDEITKLKWGVIDTYDNAVKINAKEPIDRFNEKDTINLNNGERIAVCNQWKPKNIAIFINRAKELGFDIVEQI